MHSYAVFFAHNVGHMSGGFRRSSLSTEAENTIELLPLATHKTRHLPACRQVTYMPCCAALIFYFLSMYLILLNCILDHPHKHN